MKMKIDKNIVFIFINHQYEIKCVFQSLKYKDENISRIEKIFKNGKVLK